MLNHSYTAYRCTTPTSESDPPSLTALAKTRSLQCWLIFLAAVFLVSVPVFFQAPLVRHWPLLSLFLTLGWVGLSQWLCSHPTRQQWGDLLFGFTGSWLAGSIYWGWLRWEPFLHLPVESIGLPVAIWCILRHRYLIGSWFYLGSLFGTAITDLYFYLVDLIPHWRKVMSVEPSLALGVFQSAIAQVSTPWGIGCAILLCTVLLLVGLLPLRSYGGVITPLKHRWAFGGAVLSTILVDSLFWLAASAV